MLAKFVWSVGAGLALWFTIGSTTATAQGAAAPKAVIAVNALHLSKSLGLAIACLSVVVFLAARRPR